MKKAIRTEHAPLPLGAYSQAILAGNTVYLAGQIPLDPKTNALISTDFKAQTIQVFQNIKAMTEASGGSLQHIVKLTIYLLDLKFFPIVNEVMSTFFQEPYPARTTIEVKGLPKEAQIEVEAIMVL